MKKVYEVRYVSDLDYNRGLEIYDSKFFSSKKKAEKFVKDYKAENPEHYMRAYIDREIEVE
jgi:hypothetical protein